jgi:hypothetical protein
MAKKTEQAKSTDPHCGRGMDDRIETAVASSLETPERPNHGPLHDSRVLDEILASSLRIEKLLAKKQ